MNPFDTLWQFGIYIWKQGSGLFNDDHWFFAIKVNQKDNQRKKEDNKPGQTNVQDHHGVKGGNKDKDSRNKTRQSSWEHLANGLSIIGQAGNDGTCWGLVKVRHTQFFHIGKGISTNISDNAIGHTRKEEISQILD